MEEETGFEIDEDILADLRALGASEEIVANARLHMAQPLDEDLEVFDENVPALRVFETMLGQWRYRGMEGIPVGLNYPSLPIAMRICEIPPGERAKVLRDVRIMELEALRIFAKRADK